MSKNENSTAGNDEYITITLKDCQSQISLAKARKILQSYNEDSFNHQYNLQKNVLGKILTIIDASVADPVQRKALKDLVNGAHYSSNVIDDAPRLGDAIQAIGFDLFEKSDEPPIYDGSHFNPYLNI